MKTLPTFPQINNTFLMEMLKELRFQRANIEKHLGFVHNVTPL
jgi:hypothetical protein